MEKPQAGWGILKPDKEPAADTLKIIGLLEAMPRGQVDLLLPEVFGKHA